MDEQFPLYNSFPLTMLNEDFHQPQTQRARLGRACEVKGPNHNASHLLKWADCGSSAYNLLEMAFMK